MSAKFVHFCPKTDRNIYFPNKKARRPCPVYDIADAFLRLPIQRSERRKYYFFF